MNERVNKVRDASQKYGRIIRLIHVTGIGRNSIHVDDCAEHVIIYTYIVYLITL
jgi:hypothetical protein